MSLPLGLLVGVAADAVFGDPKRQHPVAWYGSYVTWLERRMYRDAVPRGILFTTAAVLPVTVLGIIADRLTRDRPLARPVATATATWAVLGAQSLTREASAMAAELEGSDLSAARVRLTHLCARDPEHLAAAELARGTVESLAENTADAVVCSLFWGAVAGVPGLLTHRAVNTLDAMVGYRNPRYERFGKAAARLDDVAAWLPARLAGAISCALAPVVGGSVRDSWRVLRRDARKHPSPNGGWCEAAWAGALGVQLGGPSNYHGQTEQRPHLGDAAAPPPDPRTIRRAARLVGAVTAASALLAAAAAGVRAR